MQPYNLLDMEPSVVIFIRSNVNSGELSVSLMSEIL